MKYPIIILAVLFLMAGCCSTPKVENSTDETDLKIQQLEKRVGQLEKRVDELDRPKVQPLPLK